MGKRLREKYKRIIPRTIFHYTSFEKLKNLVKTGRIVL